MHRLDATAAFQKSGNEADEAWEEQVVMRSKRIVDKFLHGKRNVFETEEHVAAPINVSPKKKSVIVPPSPVAMAAVAAATH